MERIIVDSYAKNFHPTPDRFLVPEFVDRIVAVNTAYGYLYEQGILQKVAFEFAERDGNIYFALDANDLTPYRKELESADIPNVTLATREIFEEYYTPCLYSGAIELTWTMATHRDFSGTVERSWEIEPCRHLETDQVLEIRDVLESKGAREAVKHLCAMHKEIK